MQFSPQIRPLLRDPQIKGSDNKGARSRRGSGAPWLKAGFILPLLLCLTSSTPSGTNQGIALDLTAGDLATAGTEPQPWACILPGQQERPLASKDQCRVSSHVCGCGLGDRGDSGPMERTFCSESLGTGVSGLALHDLCDHSRQPLGCLPSSLPPPVCAPAPIVGVVFGSHRYTM